jgi:hypothetical protein
MLNSAAMHRYRAAGFALESDVAFSQLSTVPVAGSGPPDIRFRIGELPPMREGLTLRWANFGFTALDGRRVIVSDSDLAKSHLGLTGGLMGVAYQRGLLPLHASAVVSGDTCFAFCGESGTGKSTLAVMLARAGYPLLCDDLVIVHPDRDCGPLVWPTIMRPRLNQQSMDFLGGAVALTPFSERDSKAVTEVGETASHVPRRLAGVYLLGWGEPAMRRLSSLEAATLLSRCLRKPDWLERAGAAAAIRQGWLELVSRIPIVLITRTREPSAFPALSQLLLDSWKQGRIANRKLS